MTIDIYPEQRSVLMHEVSWDYYSRTLEEVGPSRGTRITFAQGSMEIKKTSAKHQRVKKSIARLLEMFALEADIPIAGFGNLRLRSEQLKIGLEPDECYYVYARQPNLEGELTL